MNQITSENGGRYNLISTRTIFFITIDFLEYANYAIKKLSKQHNTLPLWGNEASMNLNPLILANIQGSSYFKGTSAKVYLSENCFYKKIQFVN